ncbi:methylated-DNA--[protein]-cysteine S-methyltransferase [uncultured Mailhella sp.]|uniref:methylated-DNA--[protein]-cysteine S-methyltransferase n=1 Tax=uncultured Mailhella sp. TaxID=1981031 RepID=UPI0025D59FF2|nr:methylated-DNA--[protein]-cysteine S-methyltransferase [uncultured Mailhella sp.]
MLYSSRYASPVGPLTLASDGIHLVGLWIDGQKYFQSSLTETPIPCDGQPVLAQTALWLDRYFSGERPSPSELPLAPAGSPFRQFIWRELCRIPYGSLVTYGELAGRAAEAFHRKSMSAQAVGGAVGHNPISIIIPCHRVVAANGSLTGYAGGIDKKIRLLRHEGVNTDRLHLPVQAVSRRSLSGENAAPRP